MASLRRLRDTTQHNTTQQHNTARFSHLLLLVLDGQLEAAELRPLGPLVVGHRRRRVVVEDDLQLPRPPGLLEQVDREVLALHGQLLVVDLELVLQPTQRLEFAAQLERGQDGVLAGQRDQGGAGQGLVGVDARPAVAQAVVAHAAHAVGAVAAHVVGFGDPVAPVQEDLDDLVVVPVARQDDRGDVRGEGA